MEGRYSTRSPAVKRLMREAQELCEPTDQYFAQPLEDNLFEWHFTIRGPFDSDFQAGIYHGRIILPVDYPMKPPSIIWLTPNGRFETNKKICLSISGHHPESWQPSWSIRTALLAIIGFMPTHPGGAIGSLDYKPEERKTLAKKSRDYRCPVCGDVSDILLEPSPESSQTAQEAKELATQISFQGEKPKSPESKNVEGLPAAGTSPGVAVPITEGVAVSSTDGVSVNASDVTPPRSPPKETPTSSSTIQNPGAFCTPQTYPPVITSTNSTMPQFMPYPWATHLMSAGGHSGGIASRIPRFPYPPSHYAYTGNIPFYPPGFSLPPGVGMFPCPFPPPQSVFEHGLTSPNRNLLLSANNSSASPPNKDSETGSQSQSPDTASVSSIPPPSPGSSSVPESSCPCPLKSTVLGELLDKVRRVGSDEHIQPGNDKEAESSGFSARQDDAVVDSQATDAVVEVSPGGDVKISETEANPVSSSAEADSHLNIMEHKPSETEHGPLPSVMGVSEKNLAASAAARLEPTLILSTKEEVFGLEDTSKTETVENFLEGNIINDIQTYSLGFEPHVSQIIDKQAISEALNSAFVIEEDTFNVKSSGGAAEGLQAADDAFAVAGDHGCPENVLDRSQVTDADVSISLMKKESLNESTGKEISHSELSEDAKGDGGASNVACEVADVEQRSHFERGTSSSMPDLKGQAKQGAAKGLRQRQSANARVPAEVTSDEQTLSEQASSGSGRQRIEAVSGDTSSANQLRFRQNVVHAGNDAVHDAQHALRRARGRQINSTYDFSFMVMVGLCLTTVFLILNRLFYIIDLSNIF